MSDTSPMSSFSTSTGAPASTRPSVRISVFAFLALLALDVVQAVYYIYCLSTNSAALGPADHALGALSIIVIPVTLYLEGALRRENMVLLKKSSEAQLVADAATQARDEAERKAQEIERKASERIQRGPQRRSGMSKAQATKLAQFNQTEAAERL